MGIEAFKDKMGRWRSMSLFTEHSMDGYPAYFTLADEDKNGFISLKRKFLEIADPVEYDFAMKIFGSWDAWKAVAKSWQLKPHIEEWREELRIKLESQALMGIKAIAENPSHTNTFMANRWIHDHITDGKKKRANKKDDVKPVDNNVSTIEDWKRMAG